MIATALLAVRLPYGVQADEDDAQKVWLLSSLMSVWQSISRNQLLWRAVEATGAKVTDFTKVICPQSYDCPVLCWFIQWGCYRSRSRKCSAFFTKFGIYGADILPLYRLSKRQGKAALGHFGSWSCLYEKVPTADLKRKTWLRMKSFLGVTYNEVDDYLEGKSVSARFKKLSNLGGIKDSTNAIWFRLRFWWILKWKSS